MKALKIIVPILVLYAAVASFAWYKASSVTDEGPDESALEIEKLKSQLADKDKALADMTKRLDLLEDRLAKASAPKEPVVVASAEPKDEFEDILDSEMEPVAMAKVQANPMATMMQGIMSAVTNVFNPNNTNEMSKIGRTWRDQFKLRREGRIAEQYADFLSQFELDYAGRQELISLLGQKGWGGGGPWGRMGGGNGGNPWAPRNEEQQEEVDDKLREFLGDEGYAKYENYEATRYGRDQVRDFESTLGYELQLNSEQRDSLITSMNGLEEAERNARRGIWDNRGATAEERAEQEEERIATLEQEYNQILEDSADTLSKEQHDSLSLHMTRQLQQAEMQGEMSQAFGQMFMGSGGEQGGVMVSPPVVIETDIQIDSP